MCSKILTSFLSNCTSVMYVTEYDISMLKMGHCRDYNISVLKKLRLLFGSVPCNESVYQTTNQSVK